MYSSPAANFPFLNCALDRLEAEGRPVHRSIGPAFRHRGLNLPERVAGLKATDRRVGRSTRLCRFIIWQTPIVTGRRTAAANTSRASAQRPRADTVTALDGRTSDGRAPADRTRRNFAAQNVVVVVVGLTDVSHGRHGPRRRAAPDSVWYELEPHCC